MSPLSPAGLQVLISQLTDIAEEMGAVLRRAASSPNIKERADCSAALFTPHGELLVQAEHIPVHLGSMPASVRAVVDRFGDDLGPGEQAIVNDPFAGGTHLNDVTVVAPCRVDGVLVGWVANRAHHADLGGAAPGSMPAGATEIHEEGLRLPPVRLTEDIRRLFAANSRTPAERAGDLDAQVGANVRGVARLAEHVGAPLAEVIDYGERMMGAALRAAPDGTWSFHDALDSVGAGPDQQAPARLELALTIDGDRARFDFTGSAPQCRGNMNAVEAVTVSAVVFALRSVFAADVPANGGVFRVLDVVAPDGSILAARPPAAVGAGNVEVSQRVADVCLGALARACPDLVAAASQGTMNNVLVGGDGWVYYETVAGGQGAFPGITTGPAPAGRSPGGEGPGTRPPAGLPGQSGIHTNMTNTKNTPIEALERSFPMRVLRYRLRRGSGGPGSAAGGEGIERDLQVLADVTVSLITERRASAPWGLAGGGAGRPGENWLLRGGDVARAEPLPDKCTVRLQAGDVLRMLTPGGGGWGPPGPGRPRAGGP